jgi:quercetin dioxygenase-like cupin family protein
MKTTDPQTESSTMTRLLTTDLLTVEGKELNVMTIEVPPGSISQRKEHHGHELLYVVEGSGVLTIEGKPSVRLAPGTVAMVDSHHVHASSNASATEPLRLLAIQLLQTPAPTYGDRP